MTAAEEGLRGGSWPASRDAGHTVAAHGSARCARVCNALLCASLRLDKLDPCVALDHFELRERGVRQQVDQRLNLLEIHLRVRGRWDARP